MTKMVLVCPECSSIRIDIDDAEYPSAWICIECGRALPYDSGENYDDRYRSDDFTSADD